MAVKTSLKKNLNRGSNGYIYYRKTIQGRVIQLSTGTKDPKIANKLRDHLEYKALQSYYNPDTGRRYLPFPSLVQEYLKWPDHNWSVKTRNTNINTLMSYLEKGIPNKSLSTINTYKNRINSVIHWGLNRGIETNKKLFTGNTMTEARKRVFNDVEMVRILTCTEDEKFRLFVNFAYYTGARRGELLNINYDTIQDDYIEMSGKTGMRLVKINHQAKKIFQEANTTWNYEEEYVTKRFKKNLRRLQISNGRFHDLRRTFGSNLIKNGVPIYTVSKLLGHSKLSVTERNYAHLLITDIKEFKL